MTSNLRLIVLLPRTALLAWRSAGAGTFVSSQALPGCTVSVEHDRHVLGLFARADWLRLLTEVGFQPQVVPFEHSELEPATHELFVARKPR